MFKSSDLPYFFKINELFVLTKPPSFAIMLKQLLRDVAQNNSGCSAVGEQGIKQLIIVFADAMSHVASKASRVYRGEAMRHKSGREASVARYLL